MSRAYAFRDLVTYSGASSNEVTKWVQNGLIRADISDTTGTGKHRRFGFLDVFEACVLQKLNQIPGVVPGLWLSWGLETIRMAIEIDLIVETGWSRFVDPQQRQLGATFWLVWSGTDGTCGWRVVTADRVSQIDDSPVRVMLRLDTLLLDLEHRTSDHATADEVRHAWTKREPNAEPTAVPLEERRNESATVPRGMAAKPRD